MTTNCAHCQQPLQPSWGTQFMTCPHCGGYLELFEANGKLYSFVKENPHKENAQVESKQPNTKQELILQRQYLQNQILILQQDWALEQEKHLDIYIKYYSSLEEYKRSYANAKARLYIILLITTLLVLFFSYKYISHKDESIDDETRVNYFVMIIMFSFLLFLFLLLLLFHNDKIPPYFIKLQEFEAKRDELGKALKKVEQELVRL